MERCKTEETEKSYPDLNQEQTDMNRQESVVEPERAEQPEWQEKHKNRMPVYVLSAVLAVLLLAAGVIGLRKSQASASEDMTTPQTAEDSQEKWQEGTISYNGKKYKYNNNIKSYLFMGIDKNEPVEEAKDGISGGQSDGMFLVVTNAKDKSVSVISIHRNTMTKIEACDTAGLNKQEIMGQICLQHGYGDGKHYSCSKAVEAVSYLFYNLPISGYISLNMGGIPMLNDAVGGVEVTVLQDIAYPNMGVALFAGETKTLNGNEAYCYLRSRDVDEFDSATVRLRRQEQYITSFMEKARTVIAGDVERATEIYNSVSDYLVTDVDFVSFVSDLVSYVPDENGIYTVSGETVMGEEFEEFYVDDDVLYDLIIQIFYEEVE
ncbi:MAG: LCP family protein [Lachnospiraceae bacterium]